MRTQSTYKEQQLLEQLTGYEWCPIPTEHLQFHMCAAAIAPKNGSGSLLSGMCYTPRGVPRVMHYEQFLGYLDKASNKYDTILPAFKYSLDGVKIELLPHTQIVPGGIVIITGTAKLTGDIIVLPNNQLKYVTISTKDLRKLLLSSEMVLSDYLASLKIKSYLAENESPSLTIGSTWTDHIDLKTTNVQLKVESPTTMQMSAQISPSSPVKITSRELHSILEIQMGYQFIGDLTYQSGATLKKHANPHQSSAKIVGLTALTAAAIVLIPLTAGLSLDADAIIVGGAVGGSAAVS